LLWLAPAMSDTPLIDHLVMREFVSGLPGQKEDLKLLQQENLWKNHFRLGQHRSVLLRLRGRSWLLSEVHHWNRARSMQPLEWTILGNHFCRIFLREKIWLCVSLVWVFLHCFGPRVTFDFPNKNTEIVILQRQKALTLTEYPCRKLFVWVVTIWIGFIYIQTDRNMRIFSRISQMSMKHPIFVA